MRAQHKDKNTHQERAESKAHWKADLKEQLRITTIVAAVIKRFHNEDILKPNGTNLCCWEHTLRLHASKRFGNPDFYTPEKDAIVDPYQEKIGWGIINSSIHPELTANILNLYLLAVVFNHLMKKLWVVNQAAQIQVWLDFISIDPLKYSNTSSLYKTFANSRRTFSEQSITLTWKEMLGLIIQANC
jgi:hypothetical protein